MVLDRGDGAGINPVDIRVVLGFVELAGWGSHVQVAAFVSKQSLVLNVRPVGELVVTDGVGRVAGVVLLDEGIGSGEILLAGVKLGHVVVLLSILGHVVHVVEREAVDGVSSGQNGGEGERSHLCWFDFKTFNYYY